MPSWCSSAFSAVLGFLFERLTGRSPYYSDDDYLASDTFLHRRVWIENLYGRGVLLLLSSSLHMFANMRLYTNLARDARARFRPSHCMSARSDDGVSGRL